MGSGYFPPGVGGGAPRPSAPMNPMAGNTMGGMPRPMGAPMGGMGSAPRPMAMNQQAQYNRGPAGMGGGYDPFSSLGGVQQQRK